MSKSPYLKFRDKDLTLNDYLAIDRTVLANERTLLAYGRTALAMVIIGGTCLKFFDESGMTVIGAAFLIGSVVVTARGWMRFVRMKRYVAVALEQRTGTAEHPLRDATRAPAEDAEQADEKKSKPFGKKM